MPALRSLLAALVTLGVAGCAGERADPIFGRADTVCVSAELQNDDGDLDRLGEAISCLMDEVAAGRAVTVDLLVPTVEGDPMYHRFAFDGAAVLIVADDRADTYGSGTVRAERCASLEWDRRWLPVGVDCSPTDHDGFPEAAGPP